MKPRSGELLLAMVERSRGADERGHGIRISYKLSRIAAARSMHPGLFATWRINRTHHRRKTFEEEYRELLRWHGAAYEEAYQLD